jgi:hypothetical protein
MIACYLAVIFHMLPHATRLRAPRLSRSTSKETRQAYAAIERDNALLHLSNVVVTT